MTPLAQLLRSSWLFSFARLRASLIVGSTIATAAVTAVPAHSDDTFTLVESSTHKLRVLAEGGAAWCSDHLRLRMVLSPASPDKGNPNALIAFMDRLNQPISADCKAAKTADLTLIGDGTSPGTFTASAAGGWAFASGSSSQVAQQAIPSAPVARVASVAPAASPDRPTGLTGTVSSVAWYSADTTDRYKQPAVMRRSSRIDPAYDPTCANASVKQAMVQLINQMNNHPELRGMHLSSAMFTGLDVQHSNYHVLDTAASVGSTPEKLVCYALLSRKATVDTSMGKLIAADSANKVRTMAMSQGRYITQSEADSLASAQATAEAAQTQVAMGEGVKKLAGCEFQAPQKCRRLINV